jgi:hypothetical protein
VTTFEERAAQVLAEHYEAQSEPGRNRWHCDCGADLGSGSLHRARIAHVAHQAAMLAAAQSGEQPAAEAAPESGWFDLTKHALETDGLANYWCLCGGWRYAHVGTDEEGQSSSRHLAHIRDEIAKGDPAPSPSGNGICGDCNGPVTGPCGGTGTDEREALAHLVEAGMVAKSLRDFVDHGEPSLTAYSVADHLLANGVAARRTAQTTTVTAERLAELGKVMDDARWPEGFWVQGSSEPPEADQETVLRALLSALGIEVVDRG